MGNGPSNHIIFKYLHPMKHFGGTKGSQNICPVTSTCHYKSKEKINEFINEKYVASFNHFLIRMIISKLLMFFNQKS